MSPLLAAALVSLAAWLWLFVLHGRFWLADQRLPKAAPNQPPRPGGWPSVACVVPARDEAPTIGRAVASLLGQEYAGPLSLIVVDDNSTDGTGEAARAAAGDDPALRVVAGRPLEQGWTGKLWAVAQGIAAAGEADWLLLTDADIEHDPENLRRLVAKAEIDGLDLVSLMVRLRCESGWEKLLIPAFVFFFQKLYPFPWVNDPRRRMAAAAGGCMLVRRTALEAAGGIAAIRGAVIDDCALAALLKRHGAIWLGLASRVHSLRAYESLGEIWRMVARTAFVQLRHSLFLLLGTLLGMGLLYLLPPLAFVAGDPWTAMAGGATWLLMGVAYLPTARLYGLAPWRVFLLPLAGLLYTLMTVDSARRHWQGRGAAWKGRTYGKAG